MAGLKHLPWLPSLAFRDSITQRHAFLVIPSSAQIQFQKVVDANTGHRRVRVTKLKLRKRTTNDT